MPSSQSTKGPKLRQTCDPCRKAKVKCDKRMPICGRCIASGAPCDYGVSNQGGRWKNGEKLGGNRHEKIKSPLDSNPSTNAAVDSGIAVMSESPVSDDSFPDTTTAAMTQHPAVGDPSIFRHSFQGDSVWGYDMSVCQQSPYQPFPTALPSMTPAFPSPISSASSFWVPSAGAPPSDSDQSQDYLPTMMASPIDRPETCTCFASTLSVLQSLHQRFPQSHHVQPMDSNSLSYAAVLDINEQATSCCTTMLRCSVCRADDTGYPFILLTTVIRKALSMIEAWTAIPGMGINHGDDGPQSSSGVPGSFPAAAREDDRRLKAEVSLIGIKKMEEVLAELRQASQGIRVDYDRLACASLAASLSIRLRSASEILSAELDTKATVQQQHQHQQSPGI
ncbi:hypothetical protein MMC10_004886 [Thelotrema lepadinum]|nr:hypothetical protein [Thelotrema lepadinum]